MQIADVFVRAAIQLDKAQVAQAASVAGDQAGETLSGRLRANAGKLGAAVGVGLAGAFGVATKGAVELESATSKFAAATGATAEEAKAAGVAIADMSRHNLQGIEQIGQTLTNVTTQLGLTGDEAKAVTQQFLTFATATGQDAAGAVSAFDDILDGFGLTAGDVQGVMDKLVVSSQTYGTSVTDLQSALAAMAPQLQALNLGVDDGVEILNLFAASGLDAASAQKTLNAAVQNLPAGTTLDQFVAELASIEDPAERARRAVEVFGAKAGVGMANAIKPGMTSLDDFGITAEDAAGATERASDAIEGTFSNRVKLAINNVTGALAGLGQEFGPLATGLAAVGPLLVGTFGRVGPQITGAISGALLKGVAPSAALDVATDAMGTRMGTRMGKLVTLGVSAGVVIAVAAAAEALEDPAYAVADDINAWIFGDPKQLEAQGGKFAGTALDSIGDGIHALTNAAWGRQAAFPIGEGLITGAATGALKTRPVLEGALASVGVGAGKAVASSTAGAAERGFTGMIPGLASVLATAGPPLEEVSRGIGWEAARGLVDSLQDRLKAGRGTVKDAMADLEWALKHPFAGDKYADWLEEKMQTAQHRRNAAMKRGDEAGIAEAERAMNIIRAEMNKVGNVAAGGRSIGAAWVTALSAKLRTALTIVPGIVGGVAGLLGGSLPEEGPLQHPDRGGRSIGQAWVGTLLGELGRAPGAVSGALGSVAAAMAAPASLLSGLGLTDVTLPPLALSLPRLSEVSAGLTAGLSGALSVDVGSGVIRHEFSPLTVTVNGSVSPEAGREIGRGIGDQVNGYLRNHRREMLLPIEPGV